MSLFTVLKYGGTNIGHYPELTSLPADIVLEYYKKIRKVSPNSKINAAFLTLHHEACFSLAISYNIDTVGESTEEKQAEMRKAFLEVLKEYKE